MSLRAFPIICLIALSACSIRGGPDLDRTAIPAAPDGWASRPDLPLTNADSLQAGTISNGWIMKFGDADLESAVQEAFANNRNLQSVLAQLRASRAAMRVARADLFPTIDLSGTATDAENAATVYDGALEASWEVDIWGRNLSLARAGNAEAKAAAADFAAARQALAAAVAQAWYDRSAARISLGLATSDLERRKDTLRITNARFRAGLASRLDVRLAQVAVSNSEDRLETALRTARNAARALEVLIGRYPSGDAAGADDLVMPQPLPDITAPVSVLAGRPDLIAAEARVNAAGLRAVDARHAMFPQLTLRFEATTRSGNFGDLFDPSTYINAISAGLLQPLFRGGELLAEADRQGELAKSALFDYAQSTLTAFQEVEDRLDAEATLERQVASTATAAEEARAAVDLTRSRYINGRSTIFNLLDAQTTAIASETRAIETRRAQIENRINLHLALGDEPLPAES
ncbi:efflux transporter outer membrane subunit [Parasphingorhabdus cellanae]|uniref:Efflux transporter outer membrane subunit n=1 Tax=Parasphingorhabdus cellanae TaxID=2806553 RepID=A0ABX7T369_9SPHN|nr:efflux transporter outer membrane subunit [Parasphingorhabdus cellanae]QTD55398.1 efflux transporter outer membrane subunit [Parasphingorhabdus cellanae]